MPLTEAKFRKASLILENIAESLDISPSKHKQAVARYDAIGKWLCDVQGNLAVHQPDVYLQGSFRLGTVVRPMRQGNEREYDIDLVCRLGTSKGALSPLGLKSLIGDRLKANDTYKRLLNPEGRRCWTLEYAEEDGVGFHVDVVPSVEEETAFKLELIRQGVPLPYANHALAITEKGNPLHTWTASNPKGYAEWFDDRKKAVLQRVKAHQKRLLYEAHQDAYASVEDVPDQDVRTPLQRAIQILKRHRDLRFWRSPMEADQPISILITTLAALSYRDEIETYAALEGIVNRIENFAMSNVIRKAGSSWIIPNPVNPLENFADRWNDRGSGRAEAFFQWMKWVRDDLDAILELDSDEDMESVLAPKLGRRAVTEAINRGDGAKRTMVTGAGVPARVETRVGGLSVPHRQQPIWPLKLQYPVDITATFNRKGYPPQTFNSGSSPLAKNLSLKFRLRTDVPGRYDVFWQTVNTGSEAEGVGCLRGSFQPGSESHSESTLYKGMHWVQCFLVRDGVCIGRSKEFIVNIA